MNNFRLKKFLILSVCFFALSLSTFDANAQYQSLSIEPSRPAIDTSINGNVSAYFYKDYKAGRDSHGVEVTLNNSGSIVYRKLVNWNFYQQKYTEVGQTVYGRYYIEKGYITIRWENGIVDKGSVSALNGGRIKISFNNSNRFLKGSFVEQR